MKHEKVLVSDNHSTDEYKSMSLKAALENTYKAWKNNPPTEGWNEGDEIIFYAKNATIDKDGDEVFGDYSLYMVIHWDAAFGGRLCHYFTSSLSNRQMNVWCSQG